MLGPLAGGRVDGQRVVLVCDTACRRVLLSDDIVTGVELEDLTSGGRKTVTAKFIVLTCDAFRTPALMWASGISSPALGHYLTEQPMVMARVDVSELLGRSRLACDFDALNGRPEVIDAVHVPFNRCLCMGKL